MDYEQRGEGCCQADVAGNRSRSVNVGKAERAVSAFAGAALVAGGLRHIKSLSGAAMAAAGAGLLYRGLSGHCTLYNALGISTNAPRTSGAARQLDPGAEREPEEDLHPSEEHGGQSWAGADAGPAGIAARDASDPSVDVVQEASDESFPASDPPAWTATTASRNRNQG